MNLSRYNVLRSARNIEKEHAICSNRTSAWRSLAEEVSGFSYARPRLAYFIFGSGLFFCMTMSAFLFSMSQVSAASLAPAAAVAVTPMPVEIHIADNGLVLLRNVQIHSIDGNTFTIDTSWGSQMLVWTVTTNAWQYGGHDFGTKFLTRSGGQLMQSDFMQGDYVTITGTLDESASGLTVNADAMRLLP